MSIVPNGAMRAQIYNVKWFGAAGDGVSNDTTAIQAAINAALETGGSVYLPTGTYSVTTLYTFYHATLNPNAPTANANQMHVRIYGDKALGFTAALASTELGSVLEFSGSTGDCLYINDGTTGGNGACTLEHFSIVGNTKGRLLAVDRPGSFVRINDVVLSNRRSAEDTTQKAVSFISRTSNTATFGVTSHGYSVGDAIYIEGCNEDSFNGVHSILSTPTAHTFTARVTDTTSASATTGSVIKVGQTNGICLHIRDTWLFNATDLRCYGHNSYTIGYGIVQEAHHSHGSGLITFEHCTSNYFQVAGQFGKQYVSTSHHTHACKIDSCQWANAEEGLILRHGVINYCILNNYWESCSVAGLRLRDHCGKVIIEGGDNSNNTPTDGQLVTGVGGHIGIDTVAANGTSTNVTTFSAHGLATSDEVDIIGYKPGAYTNLNGSHTVTGIVDTTTFTIAVNISGDGGVGDGGHVIGFDVSADTIDPREANKTGDIIVRNYFARYCNTASDCVRRWVGRDNGELHFEHCYFVGQASNAGEGIVVEDDMDPRLYLKDIHWEPVGFGTEIADASKIAVINANTGAHADGRHMATELTRAGVQMAYYGTARDWTDWDRVPMQWKTNTSLSYRLPASPKTGAKFQVNLVETGGTVTIYGNGNNIVDKTTAAASVSISTQWTVHTYEFDGNNKWYRTTAN